MKSVEITNKPNKPMKCRVNNLNGILEIVINEQHTITISEDDKKALKKDAVCIELFNNQIPEHWPDEPIENNDFVVFELPSINSKLSKLQK